MYNTVDEALDFAISEEAGAVSFYTEIAGKASQSGIKKLLLEFADEELEHKNKLLDIKGGKKMLTTDGISRPLKISDYVTVVQPGPDVTYQDALIIAMKKEKAAYLMYTDLAEQAPTAELKEVFLGLAREEANHRLRFEMEYDSEVLRDS